MKKKIRAVDLVTEEDFQAKVIAFAKHHGWRVHAERKARSNKGWRTPIQGDKGWPDLVLARCCWLIFAELKSEKGTLELEQSKWIDALSDAGEECYVWRPSDWPEIEDVLSHYEPSPTNRRLRGPRGAAQTRCRARAPR